MATLTRSEIIGALKRLGQIAAAHGERVELVVVGGALMVLAYGARHSTRDVDVVSLSPAITPKLREWVKMVALENSWPDDWLNDAAKGYLVGLSFGSVLLAAPGIEVRSPSVAQMLAMKLSAWRDDVDIADARRLLQELGPLGKRDVIWQSIQPFLVPGNELKAQYAFMDLWESLYGEA